MVAILGRTPVSSSVFYLAGLLACVVIVLLPELFPLIAERPGYVWSPLRSMNYHVGDLYYYAAYVREALDHGWPIHSPSAHELRGSPVIETWRFVPVFVTGLPGLFLSDFRLVIVAGYALSASLYYTTVYLGARTLHVGAAASSMIGGTVLFWTARTWSVMPTHPDRLTDIIGWLKQSWALVWSTALGTLSFPDYDYYGSTFRYVNMSLSAPILLAFFALSVSAYCNRSKVSFFTLLCIAPMMAFSYPSHALIAYLLLLFLTGAAILRRNMPVAVGFAFIGIATLLFLFAIDYRSLLNDVLSRSELWQNIFAGEKFEVTVSGANELAGVLVSKYVLSALIILWLVRGSKELSDIALVVSTIGIGLSLVHLFATPQLWGRFLVRGIDPIWVMMFAVAVGYRLTQVDRKGTPSYAFAWFPPEACRVLPVLARVGLLGLVFLVPAIGFARLGYARLFDERSFLSQATYDSYVWLGKNTRSQVNVAAADWEDITLLPVYTDADLVVGHSVVDGRSPADELTRYIELWKFLGRSRADLMALLDEGPEAMKRIAMYGGRRPFLNEWEFEASQLMIGVMYWPYVHNIDGMAVVDPATGKVTAQFRALADRLFVQANPEKFLDRYAVDYIVVTPTERHALASQDRLDEVFNNGTRVVLAVKPR